jgi:hypothetical protein
MQGDATRWNTPEAWMQAQMHKPLSQVEMESLFLNFDARNLVAPLREARRTGQTQLQPSTEENRRAALALQDQWNAWLTRRELLRGEIKRGKEFLHQVRQGLAAERTSLEDWAGYERICGKNPLPEYMHSICAKERIEQFLPNWLKRREQELHLLDRQMEHCAKENGLEHLL